MEDKLKQQIERYKQLERDAEAIGFAVLINESTIFGPTRLKKANAILSIEMEKVSKEMEELYPYIKDHYEINYRVRNQK